MERERIASEWQNYNETINCWICWDVSKSVTVSLKREEWVHMIHVANLTLFLVVVVGWLIFWIEHGKIPFELISFNGLLERLWCLRSSSYQFLCCLQYLLGSIECTYGLRLHSYVDGMHKPIGALCEDVLNRAAILWLERSILVFKL